MKFYDIEDDMMVYPGEYVLHTPSKQIVLCGAFKKIDGLIKGMANGTLLEDKIENFQKINTHKVNISIIFENRTMFRFVAKIVSFYTFRL